MSDSVSFGRLLGALGPNCWPCHSNGGQYKSSSTGPATNSPCPKESVGEARVFRNRGFAHVY